MHEHVTLQVANPAVTETAVTLLVNEQRRQRPTAAAAAAVSQAQVQPQTRAPQAAVPYTSTSIASVVKVSFAEPSAAGSSSVPSEPVDPYVDEYNRARALHEGSFFLLLFLRHLHLCVSIRSTHSIRARCISLCNTRADLRRQIKEFQEKYFERFRAKVRVRIDAISCVRSLLRTLV